ncbi:Antirestriction protein [Pasteurella testudinis DSM 23072]|uniref:Antirestriction protein n=1 Tax=Pasteurella testudinis DSM 23072 TaxID=1122938 RepID=A0A1W1UVA7_9PAST|nr:antirestriction protein [Pasteurella testudinis]SMB85098.1 Antirestriction protein [Pasteurella testudinis DSM 23072]SUB52114.1 Antirestriction protein [Pasteurella testudinis]
MKTQTVALAIKSNDMLADLERIGLDYLHRFSFENTLFSSMARLCADYDGGDWSLYLLPNSGLYFQLETPADTLHLMSPSGMECHLSPQAASMVANLYTFSQLSFYSAEYAELFGRFYHLLRNYIWGVGGEFPSHPESGLIYDLID